MDIEKAEKDIKDLGECIAHLADALEAAGRRAREAHAQVVSTGRPSRRIMTTLSALDTALGKAENCIDDLDQLMETAWPLR